MYSLQATKYAFVFASSVTALREHLQYCSEEKFTGQLDLKIQFAQPRPLSLYFEEGNLVWGDGGVHPIRRLHRHISRQCSAEVAATINEIGHIQSGSYEFLTTLLLQTKIQPQDVEAILTGLVTEILFDLHQQWAQRGYSSSLQLKFNYVPLSTHPLSVAVSLDALWSQAIETWQTWQRAGLEDYSPNHAPSLWDTDALKQQVLPSTYQNLVATIDGNRTLRDLAMKSNKNLLTVTKSLLPYIQQGLVKLLDIEDFKPFTYLAVPELVQSSLVQAPSPKSFVEPSLDAPLIAYVDDYKVDGQTMNQILTNMGYRFIHIQDPLQALPLLLEHKPKLVFLDLVMPIVNGYEACAQIRRVSRFKDTPIIILTSNDGIVDRVRAKIVGSTGFLSKPIDPKKVQAVVQKYLGRE
ncbi:response regulator [Leptolyngbya sp. FACHB-36]|nr:response regulator [Leptolyngbya sp. FACHB-36]